jgi:hypothetical protein
MTGHALLDDNYPKLKYLQTTKWTCLFHSFASAIYFLTMEELAEVIASNAEKYSVESRHGHQNWDGLLNIMRTNCSWLVPKRVSGKNFDIFNSHSPYPTVMSLQAADGGTQHAVTVVGKLVFDSNCMRALPLSKATLDHCCSTDDKKSTFARVFHGYRFEEHEFRRLNNPRLPKMNRNNPHWKLVMGVDEDMQL